MAPRADDSDDDVTRSPDTSRPDGSGRDVRRPDEGGDDRGAEAHDERADGAGGADEPGADEPSVDERWAAIVAELGDLGATGDTPAAASQDDTSGQAGLSFPVAPWVASPRVVRPAADPSDTYGRDWSGTDQIDEAERVVDEQEAFVPPEAGPVLGGDPLLTMAWLAAAGMPLLLLAALIFWRDIPAALVQAACVVFVLGVGVLVWRMPAHRDEDDDDNGAVV